MASTGSINALSGAEEPLVAMLPSAADAVRVSLAKLFDPIEIRLVETYIAPVRELTADPALHIAFRVGAWADASVVVDTLDRDAARIGDEMLRRPRSGPTPDVHAREALTELANIAASSFLSHLASAARIKLLPSPPFVHRQPDDPFRPSTRISYAMTARYELALGDGPATFRLTAMPEPRLIDAIRLAVIRLHTSAA